MPNTVARLRDHPVGLCQAPAGVLDVRRSTPALPASTPSLPAGRSLAEATAFRYYPAALCILHFALLLLVAPRPASAIGSQAILAHAEEYAVHVWTSTKANMTAWCKSGYQSDWSPGTHTGVAYDWGGFDTVAQFDQYLAEGYGAGSHSSDGVLSCTTGVDCSGYVSRCWETSQKYGTSTINEVSHKIAESQILPGDAYNDAGSHIVLWAGTTADGGPLFYEASGSASKVRLNSAASWSYLDGYELIRYDGFEAETPDPGQPLAGTLANPFVITTFPFHHNGNTASSSSDVFNSYSCAPQTGEQGPEIFYVFTVQTAGTLTAQLSDGAGVDVDLHLLTGPSVNDCIVRGHTKITAQLQPGSYWIVADSWSDTGGVAYPGAYSLDVYWAPVAACVPKCGAAACGPDGCGGLCGTCPQSSACQAGQCIASPECGNDKCEGIAGEGCETCPQDCTCGCGQSCADNICVISACAHKECGDDGCGGSCGACAEKYICSYGFCVAENLVQHDGDGTVEVREADPDATGPSGGPWVVSGDDKEEAESEAEEEDSGCAAARSSPGSPAALALLLLPILTVTAARAQRRGSTSRCAASS